MFARGGTGVARLRIFRGETVGRLAILRGRLVGVGRSSPACFLLLLLFRAGVPVEGSGRAEAAAWSALATSCVACATAARARERSFIACEEGDGCVRSCMVCDGNGEIVDTRAMDGWSGESGGASEQRSGVRCALEYARGAAYIRLVHNRRRAGPSALSCALLRD
jgi:hypothetical protein